MSSCQARHRFLFRYAITIWYFDHEEKQRALDRQRADDKQDQNDQVFSTSVEQQLNSAPVPQRRELNSSPAQSFRPLASPLRPSAEAESADVTMGTPSKLAYRQAKSSGSFDEDRELDVTGTEPTRENYVPDFEV